MTFRLLQGDCIELMRAAKADSCDSVVCDPPYGIEFMGKTWDSPQRMVGEATGVSGGFQGIPAGVPRPDMSRTDPHLFQQWCEAWATEALRVLKPGGHLVAFGSPRMYHRLVAGIEDAGFEIRDQLIWMYGQGMPKGRNVGKEIDRVMGTPGEILSHDGENGIAGWNTYRHGKYDEKPERVEVRAPGSELSAPWHGWNTQLKPAMEPIIVARKPMTVTSPSGRKKKANVAQNTLAHGVGGYNIDACRVQMSDEDRAEAEAKNRHADFGSGPRDNQVYGVDNRDRAQDGNWSGEKGRHPANVLLDDVAAGLLGPNARFFYCAKAGKAERMKGPDGKGHPTVKPEAVMAWLVELVTPAGGQVLDPFAGSGSTGVAAVRRGFKFVGIEMMPEYVNIAQSRILAATNTTVEATA